MYSALSRARVNPPGASRARARLLIYFDVSLRKLRARAYPFPSAPSPPAPSRRSLPVPSQPPRFPAVTRAAPRQWRQEIRETSLSKVMRPQHFAVHRVPQVEIISDEFPRICALGIKATPSDERAGPWMPNASAAK